MAISGLSASSIDVQSVVSQLMQVERRPVNQLSRKSSAYETQLSVIGTLKNNIADFQTAVRGLKDTGSFQSFNATSSDTSTFTATAGANATTGTYSLNVSSLAQAQQLVAGGQLSSSATIGSGAATTLSFDFGRIAGGTLDTATGVYTGASFTSNGNGIQTVTIDASNNTLEGIRDAVNSARIGVTASIINDGGSTPYRLAFSSSASGVENSMSIAVDGDAALTSLLSHHPAGTQHLSETLTAQNANFTLNGVAITKPSNTVSDVVQGVTLSLTKVTTAPVNLTVTKDTAAINAAANTFITKYNALMTDLKSLSAFARSGAAAGGLAGDPAVRQMINELTTIISGTVSGGEFATLTSIGITTRPGVGLALDTTMFNSAIDNNLTDLANLFTSNEGFATKLDAWASTSMNITLTARTSNINDAIKAITNEIDLREIRLASLEKRYTAQFTNLNVVLAGMSSQQTFINQAFRQNNS